MVSFFDDTACIGVDNSGRNKAVASGYSTVFAMECSIPSFAIPVFLSVRCFTDSRRFRGEQTDTDKLGFAG